MITTNFAYRDKTMQPNTQPKKIRHYVYAEVFVTTQYAIDNDTGLGRWVDLADYPSKAEFESALIKEFKQVAGDTDPKLRFKAINASFDTDTDDLILEDIIDGDVWLILKMSQQELKLLEGWLSFYPMVADGVQDTLDAAQRSFEGRFDSKESYALSCLRKYNVPENIIDLLVEHSAKNIDTDMLEVAIAAGGNEDDLDCLYDHHNLTSLGESLSGGVFEHNGYYFEM